jgi:hypothetical protein
VISCVGDRSGGEFVDPATPDLNTAAALWEPDPQRWAELACAIAGRNLTRDEWSYTLPGHDAALTADDHLEGLAGCDGEGR